MCQLKCQSICHLLETTRRKAISSAKLLFQHRHQNYWTIAVKSTSIAPKNVANPMAHRPIQIFLKDIEGHKLKGIFGWDKPTILSILRYIEYILNIYGTSNIFIPSILIKYTISPTANSSPNSPQAPAPSQWYEQDLSIDHRATQPEVASPRAQIGVYHGIPYILPKRKGKNWGWLRVYMGL